MASPTLTFISILVLTACACAPAEVCTDVGEAIHLLQQNVKAHNHPAKDNEDISLTGQQEQSASSTVLEHLRSLSLHLSERQQKNSAKLEHQKRSYVHVLKSEMLENRKVELANRDLASDISAVEHEVAKLRKEAEQLQTGNTKLSGELEEVQTKISSAQEFATQTLNISQESQGSDELHVLFELALQDDARSRELAKQRQINQIGHFSDLSMLTLDGLPLESSEDMLQFLAADLEQLAKEQTESEESLKASFEEKVANARERRHSLLEEEEQLKAKRVSTMELKEKLVLAVDRLRGVHQQLSKRLLALRTFVGQVGGAVAATEETKHQKTHSHSLLQEDKDGDAAIPMLSELQNTGTISQIHNSIHALREHLTELAAEHESVASKARTEYEGKIANDKREVSALKRANTQLAGAIEAVRRDNTHLHAFAAGLADSNAASLTTLYAIQDNISTAKEWVKIQLNDSESMLSQKTPELKVLRDLAKNEAVEMQKSERKARLNSISHIKMLQEDVSTPTNGNTESLVDDLDKAFQSMKVEQNVSLAQLKEWFSKEHSKQQHLTSELLVEQRHLNATLESETETNHRLKAAGDYLVSTQRTLKGQIESARHFAAALSKSEQLSMESEDGKHSTATSSQSKKSVSRNAHHSN